MLKAAFEQIYGPPYLARMLFAEIGATADEDVYLRVDYDGAIGGGESLGQLRQHFAVLSGTAASAESMEQFLREKHKASAPLAQALETACDAWTIGSRPAGEATALDPAEERSKQLSTRAVEAALLERNSRTAVCYRPLTPDELRPLLPRKSR